MEEYVMQLFSGLEPRLEIQHFPGNISNYILIDTSGEPLCVFQIKPANISKDELIAYLDSVAETVSDQGAPKLPLVLMLVDELGQSVKAALVVENHFGMPLVNNEINFKQINEENWPLIYDTIKSASNTIRVLEYSNCKIVKRITFQYPGEHHEGTGHMLYLRHFRQDYRMRPREYSNRQQQFELYLKGIPEEDYPKDEVDELILHSIQSCYQGAKMKSSLLLLNTELRDFRRELQTNSTIEGRIEFIPQNVDPHVVNGLLIYNIPIDIILDPIAGNRKPNEHYVVSVHVNMRQEFSQFTDFVNKTYESAHALL